MAPIIALEETGIAAGAARAAEVLRAGGIVAFPTETVFGLAVDGGRPEAVQRLFDAKARDGNKPLARYVNSFDEASKYVDDPPPAARRLARALWPGPLTIVVETEGGTEGFRCSPHPFVIALVGGAGVSVVGTSANLSGEPPLSSAAEIDERFGDAVDLIVAPVEKCGGEASTVVLVRRDGGVDILREGGVSADVIRSELAARILFICTGNTCRSPLAAAICEGLLRDRGVTAEIYSAGIAAFDGVAASEDSAVVAREMGLDLSAHRARSVTDVLVSRMDRIVAMTAAHRDALLDRFGAIAADITVLGEDEGGIADPFGGTLEDYRACARAMARYLESLVETIS